MREKWELLTSLSKVTTFNQGKIMKPKLTVGMACHRHFYGTYFTIQSLRIHHAEAMKDVQLVIVDNSPQTTHGRETVGLAANIRGPVMVEEYMRAMNAGGSREEAQKAANVAGDLACKYVAFENVQGTSAPRDEVFRQADAPAVLVLDCHVLLDPGSLKRLIDYYDEHQDTKDILTGPLVYDTLQGVSTHFNDLWEAEMHGKWGITWVCHCGRLFSVHETVNPGYEHLGRITAYMTVEGYQKKLTDYKCDQCGRDLPKLDYPGHEQQLLAQGFTLRHLGDDSPWEIPGNGLGCYSARKETWPYFHPRQRGFGGEELYIHEKIRRNGGKCLCFPWLRWNHCFGHPDGHQYPVTLWDKVRNYVMEYTEVEVPGMMERIHRQFVDGYNEIGTPVRIENGMPVSPLGPERWAVLMANPDNPPEQDPLRPQQLPTAGPASLEELYRITASNPSDINEHVPTLRSLASRAKHVTELCQHSGNSTTGLLAAQPERLVTYDFTDRPQTRALGQVSGKTAFLFAIVPNSVDAVTIDATDLLFVDSRHTQDVLLKELTKHSAKVNHWIAMHDTEVFGVRGEDGGPGLLSALRQFLDEHPEWFVYSHAKNNNGFTVISKIPEEKPPKKILPWGYGPGTELKAMLRMLGIEPTAACDCNQKATQMDAWGPDGCEQHFDEIVKWMREGSPRWGWPEKLAAAAKAVKTGLAFKLNPIDPFPSMIRECIRRSRLNQEE